MSIIPKDSLKQAGVFPLTAEVSEQIKSAMRMGDIFALKNIFVSLSERWPLDSLDEGAYAYFRKTLLIGCGRAAQIAIDEGVPYAEANALTDAFFGEFDAARDLKQIRDLSFKMLFEVTRLIGFYICPKYSNHVRKMLKFVQANIRESLTLSEIAADAGLSPNYATALFKKETGRLLKDEIRKARIDAALELLSGTSLSIATIAERSGYKQPNHFTRVFKAQTGFTPSQYREKYSKISAFPRSLG
jgi:AraC-like DNA-binding protein